MTVQDHNVKVVLDFWTLHENTDRNVSKEKAVKAFQCLRNFELKRKHLRLTKCWHHVLFTVFFLEDALTMVLLCTVGSTHDR